METPLLDSQRNEAAARIAQMEAQLENLKAALNRPQQVAVLQAAVVRAEAELKLSQLTFDRQKKLYAARDVAKATSTMPKWRSRATRRRWPRRSARSTRRCSRAAHRR